MQKYDDIINLPRPKSKKHPRMSMENRAAQFSPFAALTGHSEAIKETQRLTDSRIELEQDAIDEINRRLMWIKDNIKSRPQAVVTYFVPDSKKNGGSYVTGSVTVVKIDETNHIITTADGTKIPVHNILELMV